MSMYGNLPKTNNPVELFEYLVQQSNNKSLPKEEQDALFSKPISEESSGTLDFFADMWDSITTKSKQAREEANAIMDEEALRSSEEAALFRMEQGIKESLAEPYRKPTSDLAERTSLRPMMREDIVSLGEPEGEETLPSVAEVTTTEPEPATISQEETAADEEVSNKDTGLAASYEYEADTLGMIGGVKDDNNVWQSFDGKGQAHDATYKDYSQLFREYTFEKKDGYIPVGEQSGRTVYAAPDYAKDEDGNYISVNKNEAVAMAKERGGIVPTRDMVKNLYSKAVRIQMPTQAIGSEGGTGDSVLYTQKVNEAIQSRGVEAGSVIAHGKEFFTDAQPSQIQRTIVTPDLTNVPSTFMRDSADQPLNDAQKENLAYAYNHAVANGLEGDELNAYMAQLAHESASFRTAEEYASGAAYENRKDLGNTQKGDGKRFKGRGFIQLTGRANYDAAGKALGVDLLADPSKVATDKNLAADVSLWFWKNNVRPRVEDFSNTRRITKIINGGYNGLSDRKKYYELYSSLSKSLRPKMRPERTE